MSGTYLNELVSQRAKIWEEAKALLDHAEAEKRDLSGEETAQWTTMNEDLNKRALTIQTLREAETRGREIEADLAEVRAAAPAAKASDFSTEFRDMLAGRASSVSVPLPAPAEQRVGTKSVSTAGGATVPTSFAGLLMEHLVDTSSILAAGPTVFNTSGGENFELSVSTADPTTVLTAEGATITPSDAAFVKRTLGAYKYPWLGYLSQELVSDTGVNLEDFVSRSAARGVGLALGANLISGTGTNQPQGIATVATGGKVGATGVAGAFGTDDIIDLFHSVIGAYRQSSSCAWLMRDVTLASVRKLKDTSGQYIFPVNTQGSGIDSILGKPVYTDPAMPAVGLGLRPILFGDLSAYAVRFAGGVRFERSSDAAFESDLIAYKVVVRADGLLANQTGAVKMFVGGAT